MDAPELLAALDPSHSSIVEACAGSGKTWLLVSRMLRLMLAGAEPSELLAITFTRKAAEEMRARLDAWLQDLALLPDDQAMDFLMQRGLGEQDARAALPCARGLLEAVLTARPGPLITTFHGWFFHLLDHAPLTRQIAQELVEHPALLGEEAWFDFTESLGKTPGTPPVQAFEELAHHFPLGSFRDLLDALLERRAEWWAHGADRDRAQADLETLLGVTEEASPLDDLFNQPGLAAHVEEYRQLLGQEAGRLKSEAKRAQSLDAALDAWSTCRDTCFENLCRCLLTDGEPRVLRLTRTLDGNLGPEAAQRYVALHQQLAEELVRARQRLAEQRALHLNRLGLTVGLAYLEHFQRLKADQGAMDFTDAEMEVARLLSDEAAAAAVFIKLDARWKHLLLDEFQDTNPLQWGILRAWLDAYGQDGSHPTVFLVGDPKQSIYRFRRAEPRLFQAAGAWLAEHYGARHFPQNETRRCAPRVVAWVNAVFAQRPDYAGFAAHTAHQAQLPGWCELFATDPADGVPQAPGECRLPLTTPPFSPPHRRSHEAAWVARRIHEIVGRLEIRDTPPRPARYGDITLLYAKRADIQVFEDAFKAVGIPYITDRRGELLNTLEARDFTALLTCLVDPRDDLALAHALKSPIFGLGDQDLLALAQDEETSWWDRLAAWANRPQAPESIRRAALLLGEWHALAGTVPVHDLLDRIYHQGDVSAHYAMAVPPALQATVQANLEGLLGLSLSLSGGRYPSLPRYLDELRRLRDKAGQEGPDEPPAAAGDRVRMLTIHSAKGLESPVVFLIKADATAGQDTAYGVLMDWPPDAERPAHFSLYGPKEWRGPGRDALFQREKAQADTERLNLLYVAMTRARQALFVSGVQSRKEEDSSWLAQLTSALSQCDMAALPAMTWREKAPPAMAAAQAMAGMPPPAGWPGIGSRRPLEGPEATLGTLLHAWLEHRTNGMDEAQARVQLGLAPAEANRIAAMGSTILSLPDLAPAFDSARFLRAHNELEFLDEAGRSARMDRLVEFEAEVWVLDYKTGGLGEVDLGRRAGPHLEQMARYEQAARGLFPDKTVRTALVFGDGQVYWCPQTPT
ncbi:MAG: UvrD-helicase domain-containing protein [Thiobacillus sp.]|nr:UvrD-helicase domain-containing protein [Thiobacillus sp.]